MPSHYFSVTIGKVDVVDYFDDNPYSHDPRTQFLSWGLMDNGAYDYPANIRGYTPSIVLELVNPSWELRYAISLVPYSANASNMNWNIKEANSNSLEFTKHCSIKEMKGSYRILAYYTTANMGNYIQSIAEYPFCPNIIATRKYGNTKYGFGINADQQISSDAGVFFRAGWNDGSNETWMFSEIDRSMSGGVSLKGNSWKRPDDNIGMAYAMAGLSKPHELYLQDGGDGFMLGDGILNYALEQLLEFYYSFVMVRNNIFITLAYQFILNPAYNKDRGPVNVFSIRVHVVI